MKTAVDIVMDYLADGQWHLWSEIELDTGIRRLDVNTHPRFRFGTVGLGKGITLRSATTPEELSHAVAALRSRARKLNERANALEHA